MVGPGIDDNDNQGDNDDDNVNNGDDEPLF